MVINSNARRAACYWFTHYDVINSVNNFILIPKIYSTLVNWKKKLSFLTPGVITSHLQLADPTPLGDWTIKAESKVSGFVFEYE